MNKTMLADKALELAARDAEMFARKSAMLTGLGTKAGNLTITNAGVQYAAAGVFATVLQGIGEAVKAGKLERTEGLDDMIRGLGFGVAQALQNGDADIRKAISILEGEALAEMAPAGQA